uniref:phage Gp37/Gp68 family protein n=1 Tax=Segatella hominis TaxID=2518605 RepID=UPI004028529D
MANSKIEWTNKSWNPVTGCSKVSEGCRHCYAEVMARRLKAMGQTKYNYGFQVTTHKECLKEPLSWNKPQMIFVCSMGDLFHEQVSDAFIDKVMETIEKTPQHRYQLLTKRAERMALYFSNHPIPHNAWIGVTVECKSSIKRIDFIRNINASVRFLSCEPLVEDLGNMDLTGINWIIVGGESGMQARPMKMEWALNVKRQAEKLNIPFFFKQWGTWGADGIKRNKHANGKLLEGKIIQELPNFK